MKFFTVLPVVTMLAAPLAAGANETWDNIKKGVGGAVESVGNAAKSITEEEAPAETRSKIDKMEKSTIARLIAQRPGARDLLAKSFGYAVFDTRKFSFMITTGFGAGVAVESGSGKRTYMKMATGGANLGLGGEFFQLVIMFEDQSNFRNFVDKGFEAGAGASAVGGDDKIGAEARFNDGKAVFQLTDKGLKLAADVTGTKYWKDDKLNR